MWAHSPFLLCVFVCWVVILYKYRSAPSLAPDLLSLSFSFLPSWVHVSSYLTTGDLLFRSWPHMVLPHYIVEDDFVCLLFYITVILITCNYSTQHFKNHAITNNYKIIMQWSNNMVYFFINSFHQLFCVMYLQKIWDFRFHQRTELFEHI